MKINPEDFRVRPEKPIQIKDVPTKIAPLYKSGKEYSKLLEDYQKEIYDLQNMMYAHNRYAMLLIFQGMDTAGKDGAIKHVMTGVNPAGVQVFSFKKPSTTELDHNYLWRTNIAMPERGRIGIFNRSYYEEVLVVKVHPTILTKYQLIPEEFTQNLDQVWQNRYEDIRNHEQYAHRNGTIVVKFFLHISREEQRQRFLERIDRPEKNWKLSPADTEERQYWDDYQKAYEECVNATSTANSPWYIIPGDDKKNARLIISKIVLEHLCGLKMAYPEVTDQHREELQVIRKALVAEAPAKSKK
ncbi:MAG: polyphosphate kinase 2 family protein [Bacteroidia bacterium]|nr:polyphosphate kinase 2 family protein [Bacteroidia bacterium]